MDTEQPQDDYATQERLAIYLEIAWSDYLLNAQRCGKSDGSPGYPNPLADYVLPDFPCSVGALTRKWANQITLDAQSYCDLGGATGRTLYEIDKLFPGLKHLALVEPSATFCEWAEWLLASDAALPDIPVVDRAGLPKWSRPKNRPAPIAGAGERLHISNETLELHRPTRRYDLMTCLNVIDRHPCPTDAVSNIERYMNDGGLLIVSCPFDFYEALTPDRRAWINDLNTLFADRSSWEHVDEVELYYEYRGHRRSWTRLAAQVVAKRWREHL